MRPFETVTVLLLIAAWGSYFVPVHKRPRWLLVLPALALAMAIVQLSVEGYRWQMVPAYALAAWLFIAGLLRLVRQAAPATSPTGSRHRILRLARMTLACIALVLAVALPISEPIIQLSTPSGHYVVGATILKLAGQARPEITPPNTTAHREVLVLVWYPAQQVSGARLQPYWTAANGPFYGESRAYPPRLSG